MPDRLGRDSCRLLSGFLVLAYRGGDLSLVYPIMRGTAPVFSALLAAVLLGEQPSWGGWAGVCLVSSGVLLLAAGAPRSKATRLAPVLFALLNAGVIVGYTLVDGVGARLSGNAFSYTGWMLLLTGVLVFLISFAFRGRAGHAPSPVPMEKVDARRRLHIRLLQPGALGHDEGAHRSRGRPSGNIDCLQRRVGGFRAKRTPHAAAVRVDRPRRSRRHGDQGFLSATIPS